MLNNIAPNRSDPQVPLTPTTDHNDPIEQELQDLFSQLSDSQKSIMLQRLLEQTPKQTLQLLSCVILPTLKRNFLVPFF
jgi:hypothetical protein